MKDWNPENTSLVCLCVAVVVGIIAVAASDAVKHVGGSAQEDRIDRLENKLDAIHRVVVGPGH